MGTFHSLTSFNDCKLQNVYSTRDSVFIADTVYLYLLFSPLANVDKGVMNDIHATNSCELYDWKCDIDNSKV